MRVFFLIISAFYFLYYIPKALFQKYNLECINKDFLSWDGDLRAVKTIELINNLRKGDFFSYIKSIFDSPTWPTFRNFFESLILFSKNFFQPEHISIFTMITGIFVLLFMYYIILKLEENFFDQVLIILISIFAIYISNEFLIYSFSAMLETQGALFFLLTIYFLYQFYSDDYLVIKNLKWKLFLSSFLLFQTKYPYGYLLILSILLFHLIHYFSDTIFFGLRYIIYLFYSPKKNIRLFLLHLFVLSLLLLPDSFLKGKISTYIKYFIFILVILDFTVYLIRQKAELLNLKYDRIIILFQFIILPIFFFVAIHPDRFGSSGGTFAHVQAEGNLVGVEVEKNLDYYLLFFNSLKDSTNIIFLILSALGIILGYKHFREKKEIEFSYLSSVIIFISLFGLTFLTGNHQSRHVYHFIPTIIISSVFVLSLKPIRLFKRFFLIFIFILIGYNFYYKFYKHDLNTQNLCFSGKENYIYELPKKVYEKVKDEKLLEDGTIILNSINPIHLNKADTELVLEKLAFEENKKIDFDLKKLRYYQNKEYKKILFIKDSCDGFNLSILGNYFYNLNSHFQVEKTYNAKFHLETILIKEGIGKLEITKEEESVVYKLELTPDRCLQIHSFRILHD